MKKINLFALLFCFLAAGSMTSCNSDSTEDNDVQTKADIQEAFAKVKGQYEGKIVYLDGNTTDGINDKEVARVNCEIPNDSTLIIKYFPNKLLAMNIKNKALKEALEAAEDKDLVCRIGFIKKKPVEMIVNPVTPEFNLTFDNAQHKVLLPFFINNIYSFSRQMSADELLLQIIEAAVVVDGKVTKDLTTNKIFKLKLERLMIR